MGLLLLRQADRRLGPTQALAQALPDWREKRRVEHSDLELIRQRIYGICAGYEDCNDAKTMRRDPALKAACDRDPDQGADLASQPTLSRFENEVGPKSCYLLAEKLFESYLQRHKQRPSRLILDPDTTDDPLHGQQELRYFSAYYDEYVYQPLLIFDQDGDPIASALQPGKSPRGHVRRWPSSSASSTGYAKSGRECPFLSGMIAASRPRSLDRLCQDNKVDFLVGFGTNQRLKRLTLNLPSRRAVVSCARGTRPACSRFIRYRSMGTGRKRWPRSYRIIIKAEHTEQGSNVRFVVTNLAGDPQKLYDRSAMCSEPTPAKTPSRTSAAGAQGRPPELSPLLGPTSFACSCTPPPTSSCICSAAPHTAPSSLDALDWHTLRLRLLRIGVRVLGSARRIWFHLASSHPWQSLWARIARRLLSPQPFGSIAHIPFAFDSPAAGAQPCPQLPIAWAPVRKTGHGSGNGNGNGNGNDWVHGAGGRATASVAA